MAKATASIEVKRSTRVISPKGRLSYPHLFKAVAFQGEGEPKFSTALLVPKATGKAFIDQIKVIQAEAKKELYGKKEPANFDTYGVTDGDSLELDEGETNVAAGCWIVKASNKGKPAVIDASGTEILDEEELYGGCYARININAKAYGTPSKGGVTLELNVVQKIADGEAFGGAEKARQAAKAEMGAYEEEAEEF